MKYRLTLSFYSPVHIGEGREIEPFEYIINDNILYTFSFEELVSALSPAERQELLQLQRSLKPSSLKDLRNFVKHRCNPEYYREKIPITPAVAKLYEEKFLEIQNMLKMEPFIKTMGTPFIPGSSLKGVIRTAVLNHWAEEGHRDEHDILKAKVPNKRGERRPDIARDVFKFLKLPDIPLPQGFTFFSKISNFHLQANELRETKIQLLREVTRAEVYPLAESGTKDNRFPFEMQLNEEVMKDKRSVTGRDDLTFEVIWKSLDFYQELLSRESEKWSSYNRNLQRFYGNFIEFLKIERKESDLKVIKIGFGSGYEAVTIEKLRRSEGSHGKSINLFEGFCPLGWVVLRRE